PADAIGRGAVAMGAWLADPSVIAEAAGALTDALRSHHRRHPLREGMDLADARSALAGERRTLSDPGLAEALLAHLAEAGTVVRTGAAIRLPEHRPSTAGRDDADRLVAAVRAGEPSPPTVKELVALGFGLELIKAVCAEGRLVRVSPDLVVTPEFLAEAERVVRERGGPPGITVSDF